MLATLLAVVSGPAIFQMLITLIIVGLIFWVCWWFIGYVGLPEPFNKIIRVLLGLAALIFLVNLLLGLIGQSFIQ